MVQVENLSGAMVWTFPKGHPEKGEGDTAAALREVREETGWECQIERLLMDLDYYYTHNNIKTHKTVRWFLMGPLKKSGDFDPVEIKACEWVSLSEARKRISYESDQKLLEALRL